MKILAFALLLLLTAVVAGIPVSSEATDLAITVRSGSDMPQDHPATQGSNRFTQKPDVLHRPAPPVIVIAQPIYFIAPQRCVVPGYWNYAWVPQSYVTNEWVPGSYNYDAVWIEAHYEPRAYTWGYYQPYWVPERTC